jgi:hypothetical protein
VFAETYPLGDIRRPLLEAVVLSIKNILDSISMGVCRVGEVAFPFEAPGYADLARDLFGAPVRYAQSWAGFTLPLQALDVPLRLADPEAFRDAAMICQRELDKLTASESMATRVRRLLLEKQRGLPLAPGDGAALLDDPAHPPPSPAGRGHVVSGAAGGGAPHAGRRAPEVRALQRRGDRLHPRVQRPRQLPPGLQALGVGRALGVPRRRGDPRRGEAGATEIAAQRVAPAATARAYRVQLGSPR